MRNCIGQNRLNLIPNNRWLPSLMIKLNCTHITNNNIIRKRLYLLELLANVSKFSGGNMMSTLLHSHQQQSCVQHTLQRIQRECFIFPYNGCFVRKTERRNCKFFIVVSSVCARRRPVDGETDMLNKVLVVPIR